jgi:hypothetical protein
LAPQFLTSTLAYTSCFHHSKVTNFEDHLDIIIEWFVPRYWQKNDMTWDINTGRQMIWHKHIAEPKLICITKVYQMVLEWISWWYETIYLNLINNQLNNNIDIFLWGSNNRVKYLHFIFSKWLRYRWGRKLTSYVAVGNCTSSCLGITRFLYWWYSLPLA